MGDPSCAAEGRPCNYYIYPNAVAGSAQDKQNKLLNFLVGINTSDQLATTIKGEGPGLSFPWDLAFPLIYPPAIETVYCLNASMTNQSSGQIDPNNPNQCAALPNPYYNHALILQNAMFGFPTPQLSMPCSKTYSVPFTLSNVDPIGNVVFEIVSNVPTVNGGGFNACWETMIKQLETPISVGGQLLCVGDQGYPTLDGFTTYSNQFIMGPGLLGYAAGTQDPPPLLYNFLQDPINPNNLRALFPQQTPFGPYNKTTFAPCTDINSPDCTYSICKTQSKPTGYLCGQGGKCNPTYQSIPPPPFKTLEECVGCQSTGSCGGTNICCPESQTGGVCPTNPPLPTPSRGFILEAAIGIFIFVILIIAIAVIIYFVNRKIKPPSS